jgi:hypothetical protein
MRINKIGQSANLILLVGVLLATAVSAFAVYTTFDDIVRDMIMGDPDIAAREFAANMDLVASSPNEISVYTSTPLTVLGYPAFGTILLNAEDKKIRVHPWPQDLIKMQIQKSMYGEVSSEEAVGVGAYFTFRGSTMAMKAQQAVYQDLATMAVNEAGGKATARSRRYTELAAKMGDKIKPPTKTKKILKFIKSPVRSTVFAIAKGGWKLVKYLTVGTWKILTKIAARGGTSIATKTGMHAGFEVSEPIRKRVCASALVPGNVGAQIACPILKITPYIILAVVTTADYWFTLYPVGRSITNSRHARNEIDKKFGEYSFHTGDIPIHVAKPNCESKSYAINSEVDMPWIGWFPGVNEFIGSAMNIPMSESTEEIKSYKSITNKGEECYDSHNIYLNQDGAFFYKVLGATEGFLEGTDSTAISDGLLGTSNPITHPFTVLVLAPTANCIADSIMDIRKGSSCLLAYDIMAVAVWSNNELYDFSGEDAGDSWESVSENWQGNLFLDGIVGIIATFSRNPRLFTKFLALNHLAPFDSATIFSYMTGSPSMIDSQKEYYMEDALLITISKEFYEGEEGEEGEYVLVIDKEI